MAARRPALRRAEVEALADDAQSWLPLIEGGELDASPAMVRHLEGALVALRAVLGVPFLLDR
ncbi:MAG: hypothetical protein ACREOA_03000 [Candidatus Dormibacteria bacterium]